MTTPAPGDALCRCCGRPWRLLSSEAARGWGHGEVCRPCVAHAGNTLQELNEHRRLWADLLLQVEAAHDREVDQLTETVRGLQVQLEERPVRDVERIINEDAFAEVRGERDRAFRGRDAAYVLLLELLIVHRLDDAREQCRCGLSAKACRLAELTESARELVRGWEQKQLDLLRRGLDDHRLPPTHPAVLDRRITENTGGIA